VEEWWRAIKARIDRRVFKNDVLLITGSASLELVRRKEQFPGRRGSGRDFILHPLDFSRYAEIFGNLRLKRAKLEKLRRVEGCMRANRIFSEPKLAARRLAESRKGGEVHEGGYLLHPSGNALAGELARNRQGDLSKLAPHSPGIR